MIPFVGEIIAALALILSAYATWKTFQFNEQQKILIESQEKLNRLLLEREMDDAVKNKKADLGASFVKFGSNTHKLKIWNKGQTVARNVRIEFPDGNRIVAQSQVNEKFPLESLDTFQSVDLVASVSMNTKLKHTLRIIWADDYSNHNEKLVYPTI